VNGPLHKNGQKALTWKKENILYKMQASDVTLNGYFSGLKKPNFIAGSAQVLCIVMLREHGNSPRFWAYEKNFFTGKYSHSCEVMAAE
jgi:hypothetical protein